MPPAGNSVPSHFVSGIIGWAEQQDFRGGEQIKLVAFEPEHLRPQTISALVVASESDQPLFANALTDCGGFSLGAHVAIEDSRAQWFAPLIQQDQILHLAREHYVGHFPVDDARSRDQRAPPVVHFLLDDAAVGSMSRVWLYRAADDLPVAIEYCGLDAAGAEIENQPHNARVEI